MKAIAIPFAQLGRSIVQTTKKTGENAEGDNAWTSDLYTVELTAEEIINLLARSHEYPNYRAGERMLDVVTQEAKWRG